MPLYDPKYKPGNLIDAWARCATFDDWAGGLTTDGFFLYTTDKNMPIVALRAFNNIQVLRKVYNNLIPRREVAVHSVLTELKKLKFTIQEVDMFTKEFLEEALVDVDSAIESFSEGFTGIIRQIKGFSSFAK